MSVYNRETVIIREVRGKELSPLSPIDAPTLYQAHPRPGMTTEQLKCARDFHLQQPGHLPSPSVPPGRYLEPGATTPINGRSLEWVLVGAFFLSTANLVPWWHGQVSYDTCLLPCQAAQGMSTNKSQPHERGCLKGNVAGDVTGVSGSAPSPTFQRAGFYIFPESVCSRVLGPSVYHL